MVGDYYGGNEELNGKKFNRLNNNNKTPLLQKFLNHEPLIRLEIFSLSLSLFSIVNI